MSHFCSPLPDTCVYSTLLSTHILRVLDSYQLPVDCSSAACAQSHLHPRIQMRFQPHPLALKPSSLSREFCFPQAVKRVSYNSTSAEAQLVNHSFSTRTRFPRCLHYYLDSCLKCNKDAPLNPRQICLKAFAHVEPWCWERGNATMDTASGSPCEPVSNCSGCGNEWVTRRCTHRRSSSTLWTLPFT